MKKEKFEMLMPQVQEEFIKECKNRKIALIVSWIIAVFAEIAFFIFSRDKEFAAKNIGDVIVDYFTALMCLGGLAVGIYHLGFLFKKVWEKLGILGILVEFFVIYVVWFGGMLLLIVDSVLFILRKPLVYPFEENRIIKNIRDRLGIYENPISLDAQANHASTMNHIEELKAMLDKGLITQEEFDAKKAEIMSRI